MINSMLLRWIDANDFVRNNPVFYIVFFMIMFAVYRLIPHIWKWRKGEIQKDKQERDTTRHHISEIRENVLTNSGIMRRMDDMLKIHNGNLATITNEFHAHAVDTSIHVKSDKIEKNQERMLEAITGVHKRIDDLYKDR